MRTVEANDAHDTNQRRGGESKTIKLYKKGLLYSTPNHSGISAVLQLDQGNLVVGNEDGAVAFLSEEGEAIQGEEEVKKNRAAPSGAVTTQHEVLTADEEPVGAIASDRGMQKEEGGRPWVNDSKFLSVYFRVFF